MDFGKVSICVPVYNAEKYLEQCLSSIAMQTYRNIEIIIVDDGSTDRSYDIASFYKENDDRFIVVSQDNLGSSGARNTALKMVSGKFVSFIDADDWVDNDFIEHLLSNLIKNNTDICMCDFNINGTREFNWSDKRISSTEEIFYEYAQGGVCNRIMNKLYVADVCKYTMFPVGRNMLEDGVWTPMVLQGVNSIYRSSSAKYHYRKVKGSLSRKHLRSEKDLCGYYANLLDRYDLFLCNLNDEESIEIVINETLSTINIILESWCDLQWWDVEGKLRQMIECYYSWVMLYASQTQKEEIDMINEGSSVSLVMRHHFWKGLISAKSSSGKLLLFKRRIVAIIRKKE